MPLGFWICAGLTALIASFGVANMLPVNLSAPSTARVRRWFSPAWQVEPKAA
jgi:hypothetical protein